MKIKELYIKRYGPLREQSLLLGGGFNLVAGKNDRGKTLTIDALVKLLLGCNKKETRVFERIDRVEENPEGYAVLLEQNGRERKVPEMGSLTETTGLTAQECRNIFVIRDSDLSISGEGRFYADVTDRLTGLRSEEIAQITTNLQEAARITSEGYYSNTRQQVKLKERIGEAEQLIEELTDLQRFTDEQGFGHLEEELAKLEKEQEAVEKELETLEDARKREAYEKASAALEKLVSALENQAGYEAFGEEEMQCWRDNEREVSRLEREISLQEDVFSEKKRELQELGKDLEGKARELQVMEKRKNALEGEIGREIDRCRRESKELSQKERMSRRLAVPAYLSTALAGLALVASVLHPGPWYFSLTGLLFVSSLLFWWPRIAQARLEGRLAGRLDSVRRELSSLGLPAEGLTEILGNVRAFYEEHEKKKDEANKLAAYRDAVQTSTDELQKRVIPHLQHAKDCAENAIEEIKKRTRVERLANYRSRLQEKEENQKVIDRQQSILKNSFGESSKNPEDNLVFWKGKAEDLQEYGDKATGIRYDEKKETFLTDRKKQLTKELHEIRERLNSYKKKLEGVENRVNKILQPETDYEHLPCQHAVDIPFVKDELQRFISSCEYKKGAAEEAIAILEEIAAEEMEKVSELFGENSPISEYMRRISGGLYPCVLFDRERHQVFCQCDELLLEAEKLSGGSYDQLYFSIRLALGEKLTGDLKGFFILDDPFVKADYERLCRQLDFLQKASEMGWQVIYFSAKHEVREALQEEICSGKINVQELV